MKIVHVDDHPLFAASIEGFLKVINPNVRMITLTTGRAALELIDAEGDSLDLIFMDLDLPDITGFTVLESLQLRNVSIPVVVISGSEDLWDIHCAMKLGAAGFFPKSSKPQQFHDVLQAISEGRTYLPDDIKVAISRLSDIPPSSKIERLRIAYQISPTQLDVLKLMQQAYGNDEIAELRHVSVNTIKTHVKGLFVALNATTRHKCVLKAEKVGLLLKN